MPFALLQRLSEKLAGNFPYLAVSRKRTRGLRFLLLLLVVALAAGMSVSYFFRQSYISEINTRHDYILGTASAYLNRELGDVRNIVSILYRDQGISQGISSDSMLDASLIAGRFSDFVYSLDNLLQLRWLDGQGQEQVRVDIDKGQVMITPEDKLQNKSQRYYFQDAIKTVPPEVYFSGLDLNIENGAIVEPYEPTLRAGIRTGVDDGKQAGLLLINYDFRNLLKQLRTLSDNDAELLIADEKGYWILNPQADLEWGNDLGHKNNTLQVSQPELWRELLSRSVISASVFSGEMISSLKINLAKAAAGANTTPVYLMVRSNKAYMSAIRWQSAWPGVLLMVVIILLGGRLLHHDLLQQYQRYQLNLQLQREKEQLEAVNKRLDTSLQAQRILQDELVETRKLSALGMMVAGVAHELNTPVGGALMLASTLEDQLNDLAKAFDEGLSRQALSDYIQHNREGLALLSENLRRAKIRVESFKRLAIDRASDEVVGFSLQQVCDDLLRSMQVMLNNAGVNVDVTIAGDLQLQGYPGIVSQILQNLIVNAVIHGLTDISAGRVTLQAWQDDEAMVNIRVSDNGQGVHADIAGRLFDPFVTSARGQGSTGLGLHLVHQWVTHLLHGSIRVEESAQEPGKQQSKSGLSLLLTFPAQISAA